MQSTKSGSRLSRVLTSALNAGRHSIVANTISYSINFGLQLLLQLGFFILISRTLGANGYGVFVTITSVSVIAVILVGLGSEYLLVQRVAVEPQLFPVYFGHALTMTAATLPLIALPTIFLLYAIAGDSIALVPLAVIVLADLVFTRLSVLSAHAFMAFDKANLQLVINVLMVGSKLAFLVIAALLGDVTLSTWAWWYFAAGALSATFAIMLVLRELGPPRLGIVRRDLRLSSLYCLEFLSLGTMKDLDKPTVMYALGADASGQYAAGFRIVEAASAPVRAFLYATYTRHFRHATLGRDNSVKFALKLLPVSIGLALPVAAGLYLVADYIPQIFGEDFSGAPDVVKVLAFYPLLMGISGVGADLLRAIDRQVLRLTLLVISSLALVPAIWFGSTYGGLVGAAYFRLALQVGLAVMTWVVILLSRSRARDDVLVS